MSAGFITLIIVVLSFAIAITFIVKYAKKENREYNDLAKPGIAIIDGYGSETSSDDVSFCVKVLDSDKNHSYTLKGVYNVKKFNGELDERYPHFKIGDEVKVMYYKKKTFGLEMLDVRLDTSQYDYPSK